MDFTHPYEKPMSGGFHPPLRKTYVGRVSSAPTKNLCRAGFIRPYEKPMSGGFHPPLRKTYVGRISSAPTKENLVNFWWLRGATIQIKKQMQVKPARK